MDADKLATCRRALDEPDSRILDRALGALIEGLEAERDLAALKAHPYEDDPDLAWPAPPGPALPYDAAVPADVLRLAARRRRAAPTQTG